MLDIATGAATGECCQKHTHKEFPSFLIKVENETKRDKELLIIADNYATHKHDKVKNRLKRDKHFFCISSQQVRLGQIKMNNEHPKPFVWTKSVEVI